MNMALLTNANENCADSEMGACASEDDFARRDAVFRAMPNNPFPNHGWVNLTGAPETLDFCKVKGRHDEEPGC
jgi:hypothetical protein